MYYYYHCYCLCYFFSFSGSYIKKKNLTKILLEENFLLHATVHASVRIGATFILFLLFLFEFGHENMVTNKSWMILRLHLILPPVSIVNVGLITACSLPDSNSRYLSHNFLFRPVTVSCI